jgi:ASC-1-like (ASCH) protein
MNRIAEILKEKGIENILPSEIILNEMDIKMQTWNKFVGNKKDPEFTQIPIIARFLSVDIEKLFPAAEKENRLSKHGFIK